MGEILRALLAFALFMIILPFYLVAASVESLVMTLKGYRYNSGWGRWEKR